MKTAISNKDKIRKMTYLAILTALVFVLQLLGSFIHFGQFSISAVLIPIVVGAAILGPLAGAWLGLVFSLSVFASGDALFFLNMNVVGTIITVVTKGVLAGWIAGLVYKLCKKVNEYFAVVAAALICPIVNSLVFFFGCMIFFYDDLAAYGAQWITDNNSSVLTYIIVVMIGMNFVFELLFNLVLSPIIVRILNIKKKM